MQMTGFNDVQLRRELRRAIHRSVRLARRVIQRTPEGAPDASRLCMIFSLMRDAEARIDQDFDAPNRERAGVEHVPHDGNCTYWGCGAGVAEMERYQMRAGVCTCGAYRLPTGSRAHTPGCPRF